MASQHKAPTEVTLVQEEKSAFAQWVESNWRMGAALAVIASIAILGIQYRRQQSVASTIEDWDRLSTLMEGGEADSIAQGAGNLPPLQGDVALLTAAAMHSQDREFDEALAALDRISGEFPLLDQLEMPSGEDGVSRSVLETARHLVEENRTLQASLEAKLTNPPPPEDAPRVRLETSLGPIVITLYPDRAPLHVANFLARVDEGYYGNLKFHRILPGRIVQTGDPNTRDGDPATWGQGGPEERVESEGDNGLVHAPYVLSMARSGNDPKSSGSQFFITLRREHQWDEDYTVFGTVEDEASRATLDSLGEVEVTGDRPNDPPLLLSAARE